MKKKNLFLNFFIFISLVIFYSLVDTKEIFLYVFSFSLYQLLVSLFSSIDITKEIINYNNLKYYYSKERLYKNVKIKIFYYSLILGIIVLLSSFLIGKFLNIDNLPLVFGVLSLTIWTKPFLNIIRSYTDAHNLKKEVNISFV